MATAELKTETTTVVTGVTLELSEDEANTIYDIMRRVGGHPEKSRRKHADTMLEALRKAGVKGKNKGLNSDANDIDKGMYFEDEVPA